MISLVIGIFTRILSNSYLNVFQKLLTKRGEYPSIINFFTYLGLTILGSFLLPNIIYSNDILFNVIIMGFLGALGNYFIIKALSCGDLSSIAPINSYKPIVALILGAILLNEIPGIIQFFGILLIISGTFILNSSKFLFSKACLYRILALVFSATEAIFIKKIILLSNISSGFLYWACAGLLFSLCFIVFSKHQLKIQKQNIKFQIFLILLVGIMQYSTNFVFSRMNVAYALALFQLSTILSVFLGVNLFKEEDLFKKLIGASVMLLGAVIIILS